VDADNLAHGGLLGKAGAGAGGKVEATVRVASLQNKG